MVEMVGQTEAMVYFAIIAFGIILALLPRSFLLPSLLIAVFLLVVGLLTALGMMPVIEPHLNVSVENPKALLVLVGVLAFFAVLKAARYLWKRKKSKEQQRDDIPPEVLAQWEPWLARDDPQDGRRDVTGTAHTGSVRITSLSDASESSPAAEARS